MKVSSVASIALGLAIGANVSLWTHRWDESAARAEDLKKIAEEVAAKNDARRQAEATMKSTVGALVITREGSELVFTVLPADGWHLNEDAPWSLKLDVARHTNFSKGRIKVLAPKGDREYRLHAYTCNADKTECRAELLRGSVAI